VAREDDELAHFKQQFEKEWMGQTFLFSRQVGFFQEEA
jgi:hypothetical protein